VISRLMDNVHRFSKHACLIHETHSSDSNLKKNTGS
jgi:hypothetical protein